MSIFKRFRIPKFNIDGGASAGGGASAPAAGGMVDTSSSASSPASAPQVTPAGTATSTPENPLRTGRLPGQGQGTEQQPPAVPSPAGTAAAAPNVVPAVEEIDWAGRKVKVVDPIIKDLHRDYSNLNGAFTQASQRVKDLEGQVSAMQQILTNVQAMNPQSSQQPPAQSQPQPPAEPTAERLQEINDKYWEMAHDNKLQADKWLMEQPEYQQMMQPVQQKQVETYLTETQQKEQARKQRFTEIRTSLESKYSDFRDMLPHMQRAVEQYPHLAEQVATNPTIEVLESAYWIGKGLAGNPGGASPQQPPAQPDPTPPAQHQQPPVAGAPQQAAGQTAASDPQQSIAQQLLGDQNFLAQIAANPQLQQIIISNYLKGVNTTQNQVPMMIGNQPGGQPPSTPPFEPKNVKEAGKGFRAFLGRQNGNG